MTRKRYEPGYDYHDDDDDDDALALIAAHRASHGNTLG